MYYYILCGDSIFVDHPISSGVRTFGERTTRRHMWALRCMGHIGTTYRLHQLEVGLELTVPILPLGMGRIEASCLVTALTYVCFVLSA